MSTNIFKKSWLGPFFAKRDFLFAKNAWTRHANDVLHTIELQKSQYSDIINTILYVGLASIRLNSFLSFKDFDLTTSISAMAFHQNSELHALVLRMEDFNIDIPNEERFELWTTVYDRFVEPFFSQFVDEKSICNYVSSDTDNRHVMISSSIIDYCKKCG